MRVEAAFLVGMIATGVASAASAQDWAGFYGGLSIATNDGTQDYDFDGDTDYDLSGQAFGLFAGYNVSSGPLVYGGELAFSRGGVYEEELDNSQSYQGEFEYTYFADLKGRLGYSTGNVLLFGTVGYSFTEFLSSTDTYDTDGPIFGVGVDYMVQDRYFIGAELLNRSYDVDVDGFESEINSLSLRGGLTF